MLSPDNMGAMAQQNQNKMLMLQNYQSVFSPQSQQQQALIQQEQLNNLSRI